MCEHEIEELINTLEFYIDECMLFLCILKIFSELWKPVYEVHERVPEVQRCSWFVLGEYLRRDENNGSLVTRS